MKHYNPSISEDAARIFNSKQGDFLTDEVQGPVATIEISPKARVLAVASNTSTGSGTIFTSPIDKDTYITGVIFSFVKDAACDTSLGVAAVQTTIDGLSGRHLASLAMASLTAERDTVYVQFLPAVKIDRNAVVQFASKTFTAGTMLRVATIFGYNVETTK